MTTELLHPLQQTTGRVTLVVREGPDKGVQTVVDEEVLVGTSTVCQLLLTDPTVSRRHLLVVPVDGGLRIVDQQSRNGTWLASARVESAVLAEGAHFRIGGSTLEVKVEPDKNGRVQEGARPNGFGMFRGTAVSLVPVIRHAQAAASSCEPVVIEGESGTGKTLLAEAIHRQSKRGRKPFVVVDCGAFPESLIESELFGHEKGAFTGAYEAREGVFNQANGGTVFLDEIAEMPLALQPRLLRVIESGEIRPLGSNTTQRVDIRLIAATHRNLDREVETGRFRLDLFHRLAVLLIRVPPLRERLVDLPELACGFLRQVGADPTLLTAERLARMQAHMWGGNIRELRNYVRRLAVFGDKTNFDSLGPFEKATQIPGARSGAPYRQAREIALAAFSKSYVEDMLQRHQGNMTHAAEAAGVSRRTLQRLRAGTLDSQDKADS